MLKRLHNWWLRLWVPVSINEYGTMVSHHTCKTCGEPFTLTPATARPIDWQHCLASECASYDPHRDTDVLFGEPPPRGKPISLQVQRKRRDP